MLIIGPLINTYLSNIHAAVFFGFYIYINIMEGDRNSEHHDSEMPTSLNITLDTSTVIHQKLTFE